MEEAWRCTYSVVGLGRDVEWWQAGCDNRTLIAASAAELSSMGEET